MWKFKKRQEEADSKFILILENEEKINLIYLEIWIWNTGVDLHSKNAQLMAEKAMDFPSELKLNTRKNEMILKSHKSKLYIAFIQQ